MKALNLGDRLFINAPDKGLCQSVFRPHYVSCDLAILILGKDLWFSHFFRSRIFDFSLGNGLSQYVYSLQR